MTLLFYPDAADWVGRIRLGPSGFSFTEAAESGTLAMSNVQVDDPDADITIIGHHAFRAIETACAWQTLFRGYFADRTIRRGNERTGASRVWDCTVMDANSVLQFEVIRGATAKRPKETDTQRLAWLLGSSYKGPISSDDANVLGYDVDLDKADYTGQTMADVLADCGGASGANYFAQWDDANDEYRLHYYRPTRAFNSSTCKISNVLADIDGDTVFWPETDARLQKDPARVYSGVVYQYGEKDSYVFRDSATVLSNIGHRRETTEVDGAVRTAARATAKADRYLSEAETELDTITVTLHKVPPNRVNLIRAGQRIQVKLSHLPGYTSYTWLRITRRTVQQDGETQEFYALTLELADPKQVGSRVRHTPRPVDQDVEDGSTLTVNRWCLTKTHDAYQGVAINQYKSLPTSISFDGPDGSIHSYTEQGAYFNNVPYTQAPCSSGCGWWTGRRMSEQWFAFDPGALTSGEIGVRFDIAIAGITHIGIGAAFGLVVGVGHAVPTDELQFETFAQIPAADTSVVIPRALLVPSTTNYLVVACAWVCDTGTMCAQEINALGGNGCDWEDGVLGEGIGTSGRIDIVKPVATLVSLSGSGLTSWVSGTGDIDGSNREYELEGWNGKGVPEARVDIAILAWPADYTFDEDAGTVTLAQAAPAGSNVAFRYRT